MLIEGLFYFAIFANKDVPWLAESMQYTKEDFTELTIKTRKEAMWSDGTPFTSKDVVLHLPGSVDEQQTGLQRQFRCIRVGC